MLYLKELKVMKDIFLTFIKVFEDIKNIKNLFKDHQDITS